MNKVMASQKDVIEHLGKGGKACCDACGCEAVVPAGVNPVYETIYCPGCRSTEHFVSKITAAINNLTHAVRKLEAVRKDRGH
jgi:hypothetical protein